MRDKASWAVVAGLLALGVGCGRSPLPSAAGADLSALPRQGSRPLLDLVPADALAAAAFERPAATLEALQQTAWWRGAQIAGSADDLLALLPAERWRTLQARLSELARSPLPAVEALLDLPMVLSWLPATADEPGAVLAVVRLGDRQAVSWALASALNAVRPSGREVELARSEGIAVRTVAVGGDRRLAYALLGDRLIAASEERAVAAAVARALHPDLPALEGRPPFADLEARARAASWALAVGARAGAEGLARWVPGVETVELDGADLAVDLDPTCWTLGTLRAVAEPSAIFSLALSGLELSPAIARLRGLLPLPRSAPLWDALADLGSPQAGPGLSATLLPWRRGLAGAVDVPRLPGGAAPVAALAPALLDRPEPLLSLVGGQGWCAAGDGLCLLACERSWRLAWPGSFARERGCPALPRASPIQLAIAVGPSGRRFSAEVRDGRGTVRPGEGQGEGQ